MNEYDLIEDINDTDLRKRVAAEANAAPRVKFTLTVEEVFALVSVIQIARASTPGLGAIGESARATAKKLHDALDPNSLMSQHLNEGWDIKGPDDFPIEPIQY